MGLKITLFLSLKDPLDNGSVSFTHFSLEKSCKERWRPQQTQASARYVDSTKLLLEHQLERNLSKSQGHQDTESVYTEYLLV